MVGALMLFAAGLGHARGLDAFAGVITAHGLVPASWAGPLAYTTTAGELDGLGYSPGATVARAAGRVLRRRGGGGAAWCGGVLRCADVLWATIFRPSSA
jgi:hypothetical protein